VAENSAAIMEFLQGLRSAHPTSSPSFC